MSSSGRSELRSYIVRALAEIRRVQVRIRIARSKLEALNDREGAVRLEALNEILERIALRLETLLILGMASSELLKSFYVTSKALEPLQHYAPPDVRHMVMEVQQILDRIQNIITPVEWIENSNIPVREAEEVLREAMEIARNKINTERGTRGSK